MSMNVTQIKAKNKSGLQNNLEPAVYPARVLQVIGLGLQKVEYLGEEKDPKPFVHLVYELDEPMLDDKGEPVPEKPHWLSEDLPLNPYSNDKAKSTKRFKAIDPNLKVSGGDVAKLIGLPCQVTVVAYEKKDKTEGFKVGDINGVMKGLTVSPLVSPPVVFDPYEPDLEIFNALPDWLKDRIKGALDFPGGPLDALLGGSSTPKSEKKKDIPAPSKEEEEDEVPY
jgi:hypothetical protein